MNTIDDYLKDAVARLGFKGLLLLFFFNYGIFSFGFELVNLIEPAERPVFDPWWIFLFSLAMTAVWLKQGGGHSR